jgi:hypothetical protein
MISINRAKTTTGTTIKLKKRHDAAKTLTQRDWYRMANQPTQQIITKDKPDTKMFMIQTGG